MRYLIFILFLAIGFVIGCDKEPVKKEDQNKQTQIEEQPNFDRNDRRAENRYDPE